MWVSLEEMKEKSPVAICDFLLGKVKYGGASAKKWKIYILLIINKIINYGI